MGDKIHASAGADPARNADRRRPGRAEYTNPALVALLRRPETSDAAASVVSETNADGADVAPFWAGIAAFCWWWFR